MLLNCLLFKHPNNVTLPRNHSDFLQSFHVLPVFQPLSFPLSGLCYLPDSSLSLPLALILCALVAQLVYKHDICGRS